MFKFEQMMNTIVELARKKADRWIVVKEDCASFQTSEMLKQVTPRFSDADRETIREAFANEAISKLSRRLIDDSLAELGSGDFGSVNGVSDFDA